MADKYLPTLYKKTSTGAIQYWTIAVIANPDHSSGYDIITRYGQVGGKEQETRDSIFTGKNIGKKNETSPYEQAVLEAEAKWEKQKKKGYVESLEAAHADEVDDIIEGGVAPMLAHKFSEQAHKIKYPAYVQPKLDGIRSIAIIKDGKCTLWSRTRKKITAVPHIQRELEAVFPTGHFVFDGELYNHDYRSNFEKIVSLVRQEDPDPEHTLVQYHIYDMACEGTFEQRWEKVLDLFSSLKDSLPTVFLVSTAKVADEDRAMDMFEAARAKGFEGVMIRNASGPYVNKRSYDLQKIKEFDDSEFPIVGVEEGRGKLAGHAIFVCKTESGKEFLAKMKGNTENLKTYFVDHSMWKGKSLTVQYQGLTGKEGVPRFPVGIKIKDPVEG